MPIYEYQCTECGKIFEVFQSFKDEQLEKCNYCSGKVTKLISNCSFQLKGTGWYITDYGRKDSTATSSSTKEGEKKPDESKAADTTASTKEESTKPPKVDD